MKAVKCVVWDLDNTLWDGVLLEDDHVEPLAGVKETIRTLDSRGILNSIASRNDHDAAVDALRRLDLLDYFLYPQINWGAKSASVRAVAESLNLGLDTFVFVDDDAFEREEVAHELPDVRCVDAREAAGLLNRPELNPDVVTEDASKRRLLYQAEAERGIAERDFTGPTEEFLATLDMRLEIVPATPEDLDRAEELTKRTNQLNTTGYTYDRHELDKLRTSERHKLFVARLEDRYGPYGTIGLALLSTGDEVWTVKLLLMSCRVMSRGVGAVLLTYLRQLAADAGVRLRAEYLPNGRNRMMFVTYKFNQFREIGRDGDLVHLECDLDQVPPFPAYLEVST